MHRVESAPYQVFMLALCVYTLAALGAEAVVKPATQTRQLLAYADSTICVIFLVDFLLCLRRAENRWRYLATWGWVDLLSSIPALDVARWGRAARVARIIRVFRGVRATKTLASVVLERRAQSSFLAASLVSLLLLIGASISILQVETAPESNIKTAEDAIWWALTTITTVGYGDRFPVTSEGRLVGGVLMFAGVGLFGILSGFLASWFVRPEVQREENEVAALRAEVQRLASAVEAASRGSSQESSSATPRNAGRGE
jgi:voltage-gated potassium channel